MSRKPLDIEAWFHNTASTLRAHLNISKTAGFRSKGLPRGNGLWGIKWSCDRWCRMTPKRLNSYCQYA